MSPYVAAGDRVWPDCWVTIGAMAAVTTSLRFSNAVYIAPARLLLGSPSGGHRRRVVGRTVSLALGLGWMREEFELLGQDFDDRGRHRRDDRRAAGPVAGRVGVLRRHLLPGARAHARTSSADPGSDLLRRRHRSGYAARPGCATAGWARPTAGTKRCRSCSACGPTGANTAATRGPFDILPALMEPPSADLYRRAEDLGVTGVMCSPWAGAPVASGDADGIAPASSDSPRTLSPGAGEPKV